MDSPGGHGALTTTAHWDGVWSGLDLPDRLDGRRGAMYRSIAVWLMNNLAPGDKLLLEVGCAPGRYMLYFAEHFGYKVHGIDFSAVGCEVTRRNLVSAGIDAMVYEADFRTAKIPTETYDVVFSAGFVYHFADWEEIIANMVKLLKAGGQLVVLLDNFAGINGWLRRHLAPKTYKRHVPLTAGELERAFREAGLEKVESGYFGSLRLSVPTTSASVTQRAVSLAVKATNKLVAIVSGSLRLTIDGPRLSALVHATGWKPEGRQP